MDDIRDQVEALVRAAWMSGWSCAELQERRAAPEGLWPYDRETRDECYTDWRAYGPGATFLGGAEFSADQRAKDVLPARPHVPVEVVSVPGGSITMDRNPDPRREPGRPVRDGWSIHRDCSHPATAQADEECARRWSIYWGTGNKA